MKPRPSSQPLSTGNVKNMHEQQVARPEAARFVLRDAPAEAPDAHGAATFLAPCPALVVVGQVQQVAVAALEIVGKIGAVAVLDDATVVEHDDLVDVAKRRQSMGDDQRRAALGQLGDGSLEQIFGVRVDTCGGLVEHDDVGIAQPHPGERQQLRLAGRQAGAAGAERRWMPPSANVPRPALRSAEATASSVGVSSNSVTLSRIVPLSSSTS